MKLGCMAGVEYKNRIIFTSTFINGLFELNMNTRKIRFIKTIAGEKCQASLFRKAFLSGNKAWFIPQKGNRVICVDLDTYEIEYFEPQYNRKFEETKDYPRYHAYIDGLIVNEKYLYCIPNGLDSLLLIDLQEHLVTSINIYNNPKMDLIYGAYFYRGGVHLLSQKGVLNKTILIKQNSVEEKKWKFDSCGFLSVVQSESDLYLIPAYLDKEKTRRLVKIDLVSEKALYIDMPDTPEEYYGGMLIKDYLLLLPNCGMDFIKMNIGKRIFEKVPYPNELKDRLKNYNNAARIIESKEKKLSSLIFANCILEFDKEGNISNYFELDRMEYTEVQKIIMEYKKKNITLPPLIMEEEGGFSLNEYVHLI